MERAGADFIELGVPYSDPLLTDLLFNVPLSVLYSVKFRSLM